MKIKGFLSLACLLFLGGTAAHAAAIRYIFGFSPSGTQTLTLNGSIVLSATNTGWYDETGSHSAANTNYIAGPNEENHDHHDFFVFNLATVDVTITAATLSIGNPSNGYNSINPSETYEMWDVTTAIATLIADQSGRTDIFNDLSSGIQYASRSVSAADDGTQVMITLDSAALSALNAARGAQWAAGGDILVGSAVPEPGTLALLGLGVAALLFRRHTR